MAEKLTDYTFPNRGPGDAKYDWDQWLNGDVWRLVRGEDFDAKASSFRSYIYRKAAERGLRLHVHDDGDAVIVQAVNGKPA